MAKPKSNVAPRRKLAGASLSWLAPLQARRPSGPVYLAIADALARAIETGELSAGDKLPPQRAAANALHVDLTTITRAYAQARAMGLVEGEAGRGTFVRGAGSPQGVIVDLSMNLPPPPGDLSIRDSLSRGVAEVLKSADPAALMSYRAGMGARRDRLAGAAWLARRLGAVSPERVLVAPGAQCALAALLPLLARAGEVILAEPLTYPGFVAAAQLHGVHVAPFSADAAALGALCRKLKPKALYCCPTLQNPTARTMSEAQRRVLVAAARNHDFWIIEDDAYGAFVPAAAPLARLAPERVFHVSTLSKCLSPGLRTAFVIAPEKYETAKVATALRATGQMPTPLLSDLAVRWIETGQAQVWFNAIKAESAARMKLAKAVLPARAQGGPEGFHLWMSLPPGWALDAYLAAARARGVVTIGTPDFAISEDAPIGVRISLGATPDREKLTRGLAALTALEGGAREARTIV
jgi:DNA-binding transcriptional MocR family regulator